MQLGGLRLSDKCCIYDVIITAVSFIYKSNPHSLQQTIPFYLINSRTQSNIT